MKFLFVTLLSLALCAGAYGALIYLVNPRGEFPTAIFPRMVLPDREAKLRLFEEFSRQSPPDGLVLGSSRSMKLRPAELEAAFGGRFFNFAVTGASVEDYGAIYAWVRQSGVRLRQLVIGLDVEALHSNENFDLMRNVPELRAAFEGKAQKSATERIAEGIARAQNIYKLGYFTDSLTAVALKLNPSPPRWSFDADGYVRYRLSEHQRSTKTFDYPGAMAGCATRYQTTYRGMTGLSARRRGYLEAVIGRAQADGARVLIWITPLHPETLLEVEHGTDYGRLVEQAAAYVETLRAKFGVATVDLHDPAAIGASRSYWYDCVHYDEPAAQRIIVALAGAARAEVR